MVKITFHKFHISDVEDIEIYAAGPMYNWTQTPQGKWVQERCEDLCWFSRPDDQMGWTITIRGSLTDRDATEYYLKWPSN